MRRKINWLLSFAALAGLMAVTGCKTVSINSHQYLGELHLRTNGPGAGPDPAGATDAPACEVGGGPGAALEQQRQQSAD